MEAIVLPADAIISEEWDLFILQSPQGMIYHKYDYISILAPEWKAIIVKKGKDWQAVMPLHIKQKLGYGYCLQPIFAQFWGICLLPIKEKAIKEWSKKKKLINMVIDAIPSNIRWMEYHFSPHFDYPQPFYWKGYQIASRFTYQINIDKDIEEVWRGFGEHIRRDIRKAEKQGIYVEETANIEAVIAIFRKTSGTYVKELKEQDFERLAALYQHFALNKESFVLVAKNKEGEIIAGILFFQYKHITIYYFGGTEPEFKRSGAMSLIIWESIKKVHGDSVLYDFDGSMIESIERFFRGFGSIPVQYFNIQKNTLPIWLQQLQRLKYRFG